MMNELINDLKHIIVHSKSDEQLVSNFENKLHEIHLTESPEMIGSLVALMDDKFEFDELMFSIIHTIESFEDSVYVKEIIKSIPNFVLDSPRWASIIHMRIVNSESTLAKYIEEIQNAPENSRKILNLLLKSMAKRGKDVELKVQPLLSVL